MNHRPHGKLHVFLTMALCVLIAVMTLVFASCSNTYKVEFYADGELVATVEVEKGAVVEIPAALTSEAYESFTDENGEPFDITALIGSDVKVYTKTKTYTVTYNAADGTSTTETVKWGEKAPKHDNNGYTWMIGDTEDAFDFNTEIKADTVLTASANTYEVTFVFEEGETKTAGVRYGETISPLTLPEGYEAWTLDGEVYDFTTPATGAVTLNSALKTYTVTFVSEDGTPETDSVKHGHTVAEKAPAAHHEAWVLDDEEYDFDTPVTGNITLTSATVRFTVTFEVEGEQIPVTEQVKYGETVSEKTPSAHHTAWTLGGVAYDFDTPVTGNITLVSEFEYLTVTYWAKGTVYATKQVKYGSSFTAEPLPTGATGWLVKDTEDGFNFQAALYAPAEIEASWSKVTVTLSVVDGGTPEVKTLDYGDKLPAQNVPEHHVAWTYLGTAYDFDTPVTTSIELVSDWEYFDICYVFNGTARDDLKASLHYGQTATDPNLPGQGIWYSGADAYDFSAPITGPLTLTASYRKVTVTFVKETLTGPVTETVDVTWGDPVTAKLLTEGYEAWTLGGKAYDFDAVVTEEITLNAVLKTFKVTLEAEEKAPVEVTVKYGDTIPEGYLTVDTGYEAWTLNDVAYANTGVTAQITLRSALKTLTVRLEYQDKNGAEETHKDVSVKYGKTLPTSEYAPLDAKYNDWTNADGAMIQAPVTTDLTFVARIKTFTVTFNTMNQDGSGVASSENVTVGYGETVASKSMASYYSAWTATNVYGSAAYSFDTAIYGNVELYAFVKRITVTLSYTKALGEIPANTETLVYLDENPTVADKVIMKAYDKVSFTADGAALTGTEALTEDCFLYLTPAEFTVNYTYSAEGAVVTNTADLTAKYDITTLGSVVFPHAVAKDRIDSGYLLTDASGKVFGTDVMRGWADHDTGVADTAAFTNLTVYVNLTTAERAVTSAATGLTVSAAGELSIADANAFATWMTSTGGVLVLPRTVDGVAVVNVKLGAFAGQTAIKALYIFDFDTNSELIKDTVTTVVGAAGTRTFYGCTGLERVVVYSDTVTSLGLGTFNTTNASKLTDAVIILSQPQTKADSHWFYKNTSLKTAYVDLSGATSFANAFQYMFSEASALESVTFKTGSTTLGSYIFGASSAGKSPALKKVSVTLTAYTGVAGGTDMFKNCAALTDVSLVAPAMTKLPNNTFSGCTNLTGINLTAGVLTELGSSVFQNCAAFVPGAGLFSTVTTVGSNAFNGCAAMTSLDCLNLPIVKFTTSSSYAFAGTGLISVVFDGAEGSVLAYGMFQNCKSLTSFTILPKNQAHITALASGLFQGCEKLTTVGIDFSQYPAFANYSSMFQGAGITSMDITLHDDVVSLPSTLFYNCPDLVSVKITGKALNNTGSSTFSGCPKLKTIEVVNTGATETFTVNSGIFMNDTALEEITLPLPTSGKYSGNPNFQGCVSLRSIAHMEAYTDAIIAASQNNNGGWCEVGYGGVKNAYFPLEAPLFAVDPETGIATWNNEILIGASHNVFAISENGAEDYSKLVTPGATSITVPSTIKYIYNYALGGRKVTYKDADEVEHTVYLSNLQSVDFSNATALTGVGPNAFAYSTVTEILLPDSVEQVCKGAFGYTPNLTRVKLPNNVNYTKLVDYLFQNAGSNLRTVEIPTYVTEIGGNVFANTYIENLTYTTGTGAQITTVGSYVFANSYGNIDVSGILAGWSTLTKVPDNLFYGACGVQGVKTGDETVGTITVPANYTQFGSYCFAFAGVYADNDSVPAELRKQPTARLRVVFAESETPRSLGSTSDQRVFQSSYDTNPVIEVVLPSNVTNIDYLFCVMPNLTSITVPASVTSIAHAFENCPNLETVIFAPGSALTTIGDNAFYKCYKLTSIEGLPAGITSVGQYAFSGDNNYIMHLVLQVNWTLDAVGRQAFYMAPYISGTVTLTDKALKAGVGQQAFAFNQTPENFAKQFEVDYAKLPKLTVNFTTAALNQADAILNNYAFANRNVYFAVDGTETTSLTFGSLKTLGNYAFAYNQNLQSFTAYFHGTATVTVGTYVFQYSESLTALRYGYAPASTGTTTTNLTLSGNALVYLPNLAYLELPANTKYNAATIFTGSFTGVTTVTVKLTGTTLANSGTTAYTTSTCKNTVWYCAAALSNVEKVNIIFGAELTSIKNYAFYHTSSALAGKYTFYLESATAPTVGTNNTYYTNNTKYMGLGTAWEYTNAAQTAVAPITSEES